MTFLVGDSDQFQFRSETPGVLPFGAWSFHIKLVDRAENKISVTTIEDHPPAWTPVCNRTGFVIKGLLFYGQIDDWDLAVDECIPYFPALASGYPDGQFFDDPEGNGGNVPKYRFEHTQAAIPQGHWTFDLGVKDAKALIAELRRNAKPE